MSVRLRLVPDSEPPPPRQPAAGPGAEYDDLAHRLRERAATRRLVVYLLEDGDEGAVDPGRYRFLARVVGQRPWFVSALLRADPTAIFGEWKATVAAHEGDPAFLRGLALMNLEQALDDPDLELAERAWTLATVLWATVHCSDRLPPAAAGAPRAVADLAMEAILDLHHTRGPRHLAAGRSDRAAIHAHCLRLCADGERAIAGALDRYALTMRLDGAGERVAALRESAEQRLDRWGVSLVEESHAAANDPDALARCERGMRRSYADGIARLAPFVAFDVGVVRVLVAALKLYNDWVDDLYDADREDETDDLLRAAGAVASQLESLSAKGDGLAAANQALARHLVGCGAREPDGEQAIAVLHRALAWDPESIDARDVLAGRTTAAVLALVEREQWAQAETLASGSATDGEALAELRGLIRFRHAFTLAECGEVQQALPLAREALALWDEPAIRDLVEQLAQLAPEQENMRRCERAEEALKARRWADAAAIAGEIPRQSTMYERARFLRRDARVSATNAAMERGDLEEAERMLRALITEQDGPSGETADFKRELSRVVEARGVKRANDAQARFTGPLTPQDVVELCWALEEAERRLEEALQIDRHNKRAKDNLKGVRKMIVHLGCGGAR